MKQAVITLLLLAIPLSCLGTDSAVEPIGEVIRQQGQAQVERPLMRQLMLGGTVLNGDIVRTGPAARLLFHLVDNTQLTLGEDSQFSFESAMLDGQPHTLKLLTGAFRMVTGNKLSNDFAVITPLGTIGIRGTDFWGGFLEPDDFGVFLFSGHSVVVTNSSGQVVLKPGQGTNLAPDKAPSEPGTWKEKRLQKAISTVTFD